MPFHAEASDQLCHNRDPKIFQDFFLGESSALITPIAPMALFASLSPLLQKILQLRLAFLNLSFRCLCVFLTNDAVRQSSPSSQATNKIRSRKGLNSRSPHPGACRVGLLGSMLAQQFGIVVEFIKFDPAVLASIVTSRSSLM